MIFGARGGSAFSDAERDEFDWRRGDVVDLDGVEDTVDRAPVVRSPSEVERVADRARRRIINNVNVRLRLPCDGRVQVNVPIEVV